MRIKRIIILITVVCLSVSLLSSILYNLGFNLGYSKGLDDGIDRNWNIRDPSYNEAMNFINYDNTDSNDYSNVNHICHHASSDFNNNAFHSGYRCGYVYISFYDNRSHAIVCFNTTDKGMIFIEPQNDRRVTLTIGEKYQYLNWQENITEYVIMW